MENPFRMIGKKILLQTLDKSAQSVDITIQRYLKNAPYYTDVTVDCVAYPIHEIALITQMQGPFDLCSHYFFFLIIIPTRER